MPGFYVCHHNISVSETLFRSDHAVSDLPVNQPEEVEDHENFSS
jgi:hypothetical protein